MDAGGANVTKRSVALWRTNLICFLSEQTVECFKMDFSATIPPNLIKGTHHQYFWTPSDPFQTTPDTVGPSLPRSENYDSNYRVVILAA